MKNQTITKLKSLKKECRAYIKWYRLRRWIYNYDIITCIRVMHTESDNTKLTTDTLINLEVAISNMSNMGKSQLWKAFKVIINTAIKSIVK